MSLNLMVKVLDMEGIKPEQKLLLLVLADCVTPDGDMLYPPMETLKLVSCLDENGVNENIKILNERGYIQDLIDGAGGI